MRIDVLPGPIVAPYSRYSVGVLFGVGHMDGGERVARYRVGGFFVDGCQNGIKMLFAKGHWKIKKWDHSGTIVGPGAPKQKNTHGVLP